MGAWHLKPLAVLAFGLTVAGEIAAVVLSLGIDPWYGVLPSALYSLAMGGAGVLIASRRPRNAVGWLFCGFAVFTALGVDAAHAWGIRAAVEGWPGADAAALIVGLAWLPVGMALTLTYLLVPNGRLLSTRWAIVPAAAAIGIACTVPGFDLTRRFGHPQPRSGFGRSGVKKQGHEPGTEVICEPGDNTVEQRIVGLGVLSLVAARQIEQARIVGKIARHMDSPAS